MSGIGLTAVDNHSGQLVVDLSGHTAGVDDEAVVDRVAGVRLGLGLVLPACHALRRVRLHVQHPWELTTTGRQGKRLIQHL